MISAPAPHLKVVQLRRPNEDQEYRHRMRVNFAAAVVLFGLVTVGILLANAWVEANKVEGCYASGVHSCSLI